MSATEWPPRRKAAASAGVHEASRPRRTFGLALALTLGAALVAVWLSDDTPVPVATTEPVAAFPWDRAPTSVEGDAPAVVLAPADPLPEAAPLNCQAQQLNLRLGDRALGACVSATQVHQNGSVRSYAVRGEGREAWHVAVEMAGGRVQQVRVEGPGAALFQCHENACRGIGLSRADARGQRALTIAGLPLQPAAAGGPVLQLSARLQVPADDLLAGLACDGPSVVLGSADGARQKFCAHGGAGFEIADNGELRVQFLNLEGEVLQVALAGDSGRLQSLQFGDYGCEGAACGGASVQSQDPGDPLAERQFFFGHTVLTRTVGGGGDAPRELTLDGHLVLPAQQ